MALSLLDGGASVARRQMRAIDLRNMYDGTPILGPGSEYLKSLCHNICALDSSTRIFPEDDAQHMGCDQAFTKASKWIAECLTGHSKCINSENSEGPMSILPSRVIDVGPSRDQRATRALHCSKPPLG